MNNSNKIHELKIDEAIWIIFILLSIANIFGDECEKKYYQFDSFKDEEKAKLIFLISLVISFLVYCYMDYQKLEKYYVAKRKGDDTTICGLRLIGGTLVVVSTLLFLYCQVMEKSPQNPSIV